MDMKENEDRMGRTLDALEHPGRFTKEELEELLADRECVAACRDLLDCREALARRHAAAPDVDGQWEAFCRRHPDAAGAARGRKRMRRAAWWTALAVAASLALLMMLPLTGRREYTVFRAGPAGGEVKEEVRGGIRTVRIPRGMSRRLVLPDGSRVWLNAESSLSYPGSFGGRERREVTLQGEAYFEVAPDSLHPFVVETAALQTQVLGTSFNVRAYSPEDTRVTLLRGSVKVSDRHRGKLLLRPGEGTDCSLGRKTVDDAEDCRAWTDGRFAFDDAPLVEIMRELGRWYNVDIVFTDREVMQERLHFRADRRDSLEQVLELLNCLRKVRARIEDGRVVVGI